MNDIPTMMGKPLEYWLELERSRKMSEVDLIQDSVTLRAKVSYYEEMIKRMMTFGKLA